jgi:4-amino-4-deoxy-L-arabinose transferase-like glycosyltransferase
MRRILPLLLLLAAYLAAGFLFATRTPAWQAPDEPAHYNYIRQLSEGQWPVIEAQDYDEAYRSAAVSARFAPPYSIDPLTYEDWQPPLYYLLQTPLFTLTNGELAPLRLMNLLIGAVTVALAYGIGRLLWPRRSWLALLVAAFVALLPQHLALLASLNNDSLAELLIAAILWLTIRQTQRETDVAESLWFSSGVLLGLGFLTKATVYIMAPVLALALLWHYRRQTTSLVRNGLLVFVPAFLLGLPWWLRNLLVYPGFDPLANRAHDSVVVGQVRTAEWLAAYGLAGTVQRFLQTTFQSFWGQFGWMGVVMDRRIYLLLLLFTLAVLAGFVWAVVQWVRSAGPDSPSITRGSALILAATFSFSLLVYLGYNLTFVQHQGRYLFPALIPIAIAVAISIKSWMRPLLGRLPSGHLPLAGTLSATLFTLALLALDLFALYNFIIPQLTTP